MERNELRDGGGWRVWGGKMVVMGGRGGMKWFDREKVKEDGWEGKVRI